MNFRQAMSMANAIARRTGVRQHVTQCPCGGANTPFGWPHFVVRPVDWVPAREFA